MMSQRVAMPIVLLAVLLACRASPPEGEVGPETASAAQDQPPTLFVIQQRALVYLAFPTEPDSVWSAGTRLSLLHANQCGDALTLGQDVGDDEFFQFLAPTREVVEPRETRWEPSYFLGFPEGRCPASPYREAAYDDWRWKSELSDASRELLVAAARPLLEHDAATLHLGVRWAAAGQGDDYLWGFIGGRDYRSPDWALVGIRMSAEGAVVEHAEAPEDQYPGPEEASLLGFTDLDGDGSPELLVTFAKHSPSVDLTIVLRVYERSEAGAWTVAEEHPLFEELRAG